ncbi:TolC family protein [Desulfococcaceae bacterium HSG7]|nr:TolC family protein [Desulfococcaceae bacterium HSG7]
MNASLERSATSLKRKRYLPSISFSASQEHVFSRSGAGADIPGADPVDTPWTAGIYLSLPFYEGGSVSVDIKNLKLEIARIDKQKLIIAQKTERTARDALSDVMVKTVNLESSKQAAAYAKQSLELVRDSYAKGTVSVVELADAQNNALNNELSAINSIYEYLMSLFEMERVYGRYSLLMPLDSDERLTRRFKEYYDKSFN